MDIKKLEKLAELCRKHGISYYKTADVELKFDHPTFEEKPVSYPNIDKVIATSTYTEEELLDWSTNMPNENLPE